MLGHVHHAEASLADFLQKLEGADHAPWLVSERVLERSGQGERRDFEKIARAKVVLDQLVHAPLQLGVPGAGSFDERPALRHGRDFDRGGEHGFNAFSCGIHVATIQTPDDCLYSMRKTMPDWSTKSAKDS